MFSWHHQLHGDEFEHDPGVGDGQGGLACCGSWGHKRSATTEWLTWTELECNMPVFPALHHLPEFAQTYVHWVNDTIQPFHPLSSPSPPAFISFFYQHQGLFHWVSSSHPVAKGLVLHFSISPSSEYSGLISLRMDWCDLLAVWGTLKSFSSVSSQLITWVFCCPQTKTWYKYLSSWDKIAVYAANNFHLGGHIFSVLCWHRCD